jgi:hypothetical protein
LKRQILFSFSNPPHSSKRFLAGAFTLLILFNPVRAQQVIAIKAGMISYTEGKVFRDNEAVRRAANGFITLKNGQTLRTGTGRVELLLSPNVYLRVGENSSLRMEQDLLSDTRLVLDRGSALIEVVLGTKGNVIHLRYGKSSIEIARTGLYRIDAGAGELRIYGGSAIVAYGEREIEVKRGRMVRLDDTLAVSKFDRDLADPLHEWAARRSFYLFTVNSRCGEEMQNWIPTKGGGMYSSNFRMRFYWKAFADEYSAQQKANDAAREDRIRATSASIPAK